MRAESTQAGPHPDLKNLGLYAAGDLPWISRLRIRRHVSICAECDRQVARFRECRTELKRQADAETLPGMDWNRLEREMLGNIGVGVAAARCIDNVGHRRSFSRGLLVVAGLIVLFAVGWFTHIPREQNEHLLASLRRLAGMNEPLAPSTVLQTTPEGIAVKNQGGTLTLLHPGSAIVSLSGDSTVTARYVDENTGQVTITKVYGE